MAHAEMINALATKSLSQFTDSEMEEARNLAYSILRAYYWKDVRDVVDSIQTAITDGEVADREDLMERIHEECDGHQRVIYTSRAIETLLISDNQDAHVEEFGAEGIVQDGSINWSAMAYSAFERDVIEDLKAEDIDVDDFEIEEDDDEGTKQD